MQVPGQWALLPHPTHAAGAIWVMIPTPFRFRFRWEAGWLLLAKWGRSTGCTSTVAPCCILGSPAAGGDRHPQPSGSAWDETEGQEPRGALTQEQQRKTMQKDSMMPAIPTTQVRRRNRMTPKMFWRQGR